MKKGLTELVFILDRSGSMGGLESDTIGGFNGMLGMYKLKRLLNSRSPASVNIVTLLDKPQRREVPIEPEYTGFVIEDEFVIGYGLDYDEEYRNLPYVGVLKREVYE